MNATNIKIPVWFWIVSVVLLIWNAMGVMAYILQMTISAEALQALPEVKRNLYETFPIWANIAFFLAVFGGTLGSLGLVLRKKWAYYAFLVSLVGIIIQMSYNIFVAKAMDIYGPAENIMAFMILIIGVVAIWFVKWCTKKVWLS